MNDSFTTHVNNGGSDLTGLSSIRHQMHSSENYTVRRKLNSEEVYEYIKRKIENDEVLKLRESEKELTAEERTREYYRKNFDFYRTQILSYLNADGIGVFDTGSDGRSIELKRGEVVRSLTSFFVGFDCLEDAMDDPYVTDIYCIKWDEIYVERDGKNELYKKTFRSKSAYKNFVDRLLRISGKQLDQGENKIVDFEVYGNRGNVDNEMVSSKGICLTIRKHNEIPIKLSSMIEGKLMTKEIADMLGLFIEGETNMIVAGITGSGKTTTLRALLDNYVPPLNKRVLVLEDTPELFLKNPHTVNLITVPTDNEKTNISLRDLNIAALRMKPKYIIVGEVRGPEAEAMIEGMETGHSTITTMHGGNVWNIINRLVTKYLMQMPSLSIDVVERIIGAALNFVIVQDDVPNIGRRITSIHEIGYDFEHHSVTAKCIVKYDFERNDWVFENMVGQEPLNVMTRRGVSIEKIKKLNAYINSKIEETKGNS